MTTYKINNRRHWYGTRDTVADKIDDETGQPWRGTRAETKAKIAELDHEVYELAHNESSRPDYRLAKALD